MLAAVTQDPRMIKERSCAHVLTPAMHASPYPSKHIPFIASSNAELSWRSDTQGSGDPEREPLLAAASVSQSSAQYVAAEVTPSPPGVWWDGRRLRVLFGVCLVGLGLGLASDMARFHIAGVSGGVPDIICRGLVAVWLMIGLLGVSGLPKCNFLACAMATFSSTESGSCCTFNREASALMDAATRRLCGRSRFLLLIFPASAAVWPPRRAAARARGEGWARWRGRLLWDAPAWCVLLPAPCAKSAAGACQGGTTQGNT